MARRHPVTAVETLGQPTQGPGFGNFRGAFYVSPDPVASPMTVSTYARKIGVVQEKRHMEMNRKGKKHFPSPPSPSVHLATRGASGA